MFPRGFAGPSLLAMILFEKGQHQPLNRQASAMLDLSLWTPADQVGGEFFDARKAPLGDVYLYDFGDGWERTIKWSVSPIPSRVCSIRA